MSMANSLLSTSTEAINYQSRSPLLLELTAAINNMRDLQSGVDYTSLNKSSIPKIIFDRTGLRFELHPHADSPHEFAASIRAMDHTNPLQREMAQSRVDNQGLFGSGVTVAEIYEVSNQALRRCRQLRGSLDLNKGRVSGVFSEILNPLVVPAAAFTREFPYSADEVAAVMIHEIGHVWSGFESIVNTTSMNVIAATAAAALTGDKAATVDVSLVEESLSFLGVNAKETIEIARKAAKRDDAYVVILKSAMDARQHYMNSYASNRWTGSVFNTLSDTTEFLADQFAARHGASVALASFLQKASKANPNWKASTNAIAATVMSCGLLASLALTAGPAGVIPAIFILGITTSSIGIASLHGADHSTTVHERLGLLKQDLVQILKNPKISPKHRKELLSDLERLEGIRKLSKENLTISSFLSRHLIPSGRRAVKLRDFQRTLEELTNNPLFVASQKMRDIA